MKPHLSIQRASKTFGEFAAVQETCLDITEGEFITFLGPSGSGKSTLLNMIAGIENVSSGDIQLQGATLLTIPPHLRNIGMVFQRYTLVPHMTVFENVAFPLKVRRWPTDKVKARVLEMLALVRLDEFANRKPSQLSGGQQQRVALARALAYHPKILLMDEPLAALDKKLKEALQSEIKRIHRETGVTVIYVTHDQDEALLLSDRIAVFNTGRIEQVAKPLDLYEHPATRFVGSFVGNSNFLDVTLDRDRSLEFPDGTKLDGVTPTEDIPPGKYELLVRPERVNIAGTIRHDGPVIPVTIRELNYLGEMIKVEAVTNWGCAVSVRLSATALPKDIALGGSALLHWAADHGVLYGSDNRRSGLAHSRPARSQVQITA